MFLTFFSVTLRFPSWTYSVTYPSDDGASAFVTLPYRSTVYVVVFRRGSFPLLSVTLRAQWRSRGALVPRSVARRARPFFVAFSVCAQRCTFGGTGSRSRSGAPRDARERNAERDPTPRPW